MHLYNKFFFVFYDWAKKRGRLSPYYEAVAIVVIHNFLIGTTLFYTVVKFDFLTPGQLFHPLWINFAIIMAIVAGLTFLLAAPKQEFAKIDDFGEIVLEPDAFRAFSWLWFVIVVLAAVVIPLMNGGIFLDD